MKKTLNRLREIIDIYKKMYVECSLSQNIVSWNYCTIHKREKGRNVERVGIRFTYFNGVSVSVCQDECTQINGDYIPKEEIDESVLSQSIYREIQKNYRHYVNDFRYELTNNKSINDIVRWVSDLISEKSKYDNKRKNKIAEKIRSIHRNRIFRNKQKTNFIMSICHKADLYGIINLLFLEAKKGNKNAMYSLVKHYRNNSIDDALIYIH